MAELSLVTSPTFSPPIFHQELQTHFPTHGRRQDIVRCGFLHLNSHHLDDRGQRNSLSSDCGPSCIIPMEKKPVLIDVQDSRPDSILFSFGIAGQCTRHEKILKFLTSGSKLTEQGLNMALLSDLMGFRNVAIGVCHQAFIPNLDLCLYEIGMAEPQLFLNPQSHFYTPHSLLSFFGNKPQISVLTVNRSGQVLFTGNEAEMQDLLSMIAEFNLSKRSTGGSKLPMLVPYFTRKFRAHSRANNQVSSLGLHSETVAPLKSSHNLKWKAMPKKKETKKAGRKRDLYHKNYFHACESLLTLILDKNKGTTATLSLKKSGREISQLLTQLSAGIAGTGLAVLFSIGCKMAGGRVPFCTTKLLNTGFGLGLFWLSWAVYGLRDTIISISKKSGPLKLEEEEVAGKIEKSMNDVLFRAAALVAVAALRFV
ncbi:uncharacterized protein LOC109719314 isoform X1 [Ananas comosus]|uniref:Uncharacterized protein LOC109719314 isoform X1 n=2 Tax=Ananas comosus TaxID=4615 RepID=A0A6P5G0Y1_ANACO|nr:uncharacterized protein LOC109719314 isoform X1 [Ananas comosus]